VQFGDPVLQHDRANLARDEKNGRDARRGGKRQPDRAEDWRPGKKVCDEVPDPDAERKRNQPRHRRDEHAGGREEEALQNAFRAGGFGGFFAALRAFDEFRRLGEDVNFRLDLRRRSRSHGFVAAEAERARARLALWIGHLLFLASDHPFSAFGDKTGASSSTLRKSASFLHPSLPESGRRLPLRTIVVAVRSRLR
jgi:hypothetical protein